MVRIGDTCNAIGRDPETVVLTMFYADPQIDKVKYLPDIGCDRAVFYLPAEPADAVLPILDRYTKMM
jgi:hypothetical protein